MSLEGDDAFDWYEVLSARLQASSAAAGELLEAERAHAREGRPANRDGVHPLQGAAEFNDASRAAHTALMSAIDEETGDLHPEELRRLEDAVARLEGVIERWRRRLGLGPEDPPA